MSHPVRILIVEDLETAFELAQREIHNLMKDCVFQRVETNKEFLLALEAFQPDLILANYSLPSFNGIEALGLARKHASLIPFIIWTGSLNEDIAVECMKAGANNYIFKGNIQRLGPAITHALEERREAVEHKLAEGKLQDGEKRFRALIENGMDNISLLGSDGTLLWENPATHRNLGYGQDEFVGKNIFELMHPDDIEWASNLFAQLVQEPGSHQDGTFRLRHHDGTWRWNAGTATNMLDEPSVKAIVVNYRDVTDRKQAQDAVERSEAILAQAGEMAHLGAWEIEVNNPENLNDNPLRWSDEVYRIFGYEPETIEVTNDLFFSHVHPDDRQKVQMVLNNAIARKIPYEVEHRVIRVDGSERIVEEHANLIFNKQSQLIQMLGAVQDITDHKRAETALRLSEERYRDLINQLPVIVYTDEAVGGSGYTRFVSPQIKTILGFEPEEWIDGSFDLWQGQIHPEDRERVIKQYMNCIQEGKQFECEYRIRTKSGQTIWLHDQSSMLIDTQGRPISSHGIIYDITERKKAEEDIQRRVAELEALHENGLAISRLLDPKLISEKVVDVLQQKLHWHHAAIRLYHPENNQLELVALNHPGLPHPQLKEHIDYLNKVVSDPNKGLTGWVIKQRLPLRSGDLMEDPRYIETYAGMKSGLYVPILAGERVLGAISVESEIENAFTEQDERLLMTLTNQAAVAIENAKLYLMVQKELDERQQAEERYRALFEDTPVAIWEEDFSELKTHLDSLKQQGITDFGSYFSSHPDAVEECASLIRVLNANNSAVQMFKARSKTELITTTSQEMSQGEREHCHEDCIAIAEGRLSNSWEGLDTNLAGEPIEIALSWSVAPGHELDFSRVIVTTLDITERKRAEKALRRSEAQYRLLSQELELRVDERTAEVQDLYDNAPCGYHSLDSHGKIIRVNQTELDWLGYTREEMLEKPFKDFVTKESYDIFHENFPAFKKNGWVKDLEFDMQRKDGSTFPILVSATAIYDKDGNYLTSRSTLFDNTERKYALETLRLANAEMKRALSTKDEFLANMSHELRTPLNAILGLSESLLEQTSGPLNERQQKYLNTVNESGHHLLELINDILDLAKIEAGQIKLDPGKVDVNHICQSSLRMIKQLAQKKNQEVEYQVEENIDYIWADERRLKQMIVNLLSNAVKFTPEGGKLGLKVHIDREETKLLITVWDNGIGIREEDLSRLFQPFVQLDSSLARESGGTGLGLALVAQMARLHGGSISVSSHIGKGSRFSVVLPWEPAITSETIERFKITGRFPNIKTYLTDKRTILLVEDTDSVVMLLRDYLELAGYKVEVARDGVNGVSKAITLNPDLILMDVQMPGMDGLEATRLIRQEVSLRHTPIIALTALAMINDHERCIEAGMNNYISKPVNLKALVKMIQDYLPNVGMGK